MSPPSPSHSLLAQLLDHFPEWPKGVVWDIHHPEQQLLGKGFFPAAHGLYTSELDAHQRGFPTEGVMVLAHDWGTRNDYAQFLKKQQEGNNPTWRNLGKLLEDAELDPALCFFTNFFMGLREEGSSVGRFPGAHDEPHVQRCQSFFLKQVAVQRPKLILVLGRFVPELVAETSTHLAMWKRFDTYRKMDQRGATLVAECQFESIGHRAVVVALVHPCYRTRNAKYRSWNGSQGEEAELAMLRHAMNIAGLTL